MKKFITKTMIWQKFRKTKFYQFIKPFHGFTIRLRFINWLVHHLIYKTQGLSFSLHFTSRITNADKVILGNNVWFSLAVNGGCYIGGANGIEIGDDTIIASGVKLISSNHDLQDYSKYTKNEPIRIGKRCWLGVNCIILPGVQLGDEVIVGAGAVVTKSFDSRSVIAGVPARTIKKLTHEGQIHILIKAESEEQHGSNIYN